MKIKLNSGWQRAELEVAAARLPNITEDRLSIRATVAYINDAIVDDLLHELEVSRAKAAAGDHAELARIDDGFLGQHASTRGRANAIGSIKRAIAAARS